MAKSETTSTPFSVEDWQDAPALRRLRYENDDPLIIHAGMLPYYPDPTDGATYFLVASPKPKQGDAAPLPFQLSRGHRQVYKDGAWVDMRGEETIACARAAMERGEENDLTTTPLATAIREAAEELSLDAENIAALADCGVLGFTNAEGEHYGIHFFAARAREKFPPAPTEDSYAVAWLTARRIEEAAQGPIFVDGVSEARFKPVYLPIFHAIAVTVAYP